MQKILIVHDEQLLSAAIVTLLCAESDLDVYNFPADRTTKLVEKIGQICPDVVILGHTPLLAEYIQSLLPVLGGCPDLRLIVISANHNWLNIYSTHQINVRRPSDLINAIRCSQG